MDKYLACNVSNKQKKRNSTVNVLAKFNTVELSFSLPLRPFVFTFAEPSHTPSLPCKIIIRRVIAIRETRAPILIF